MLRRSCIGRAALFTVLFLLSAATLRAEIIITLQNDFIEQYKNRVTIDTNYVVDKAHPRPNPPSKDGDLHAAGRADEVKLPIVAEIMNAKFENEGVDLIHQVEGTGKPIALSGAWRLWCEHGGNSQQIQGEPLEPFDTTNPPHVFEVHPITALNGRSILPTLKPIKGFKTKDAETAFTKYEGVRCRIIPSEGATTLVTTMAGYNYVEFVMELNSTPQTVEDGVMVMCKVRDLEDELLVNNRRMVIVKDSEVEKRIRGKGKGTKVHVLGLPRIDLALVSWRVQAAAKGNKDVLTWGLPYEIIVVGFHGFVTADENATDEMNAKSAKGKTRFIPKTLSPKEVEKHRLPAAPPE